jgi:hypothetical protein
MIENAQTLEQLQLTPPIKRKRGRPTKVSQGILPTDKKDKVEPPKPDKNPAESTEIKLTKLLQINLARYDTLDHDTYKDKLEKMTLPELHEECVRVGLRPVNDRGLTTQTLLQVFRQEVVRLNPSAGGIDRTKLSVEARNKLTQLMKDAR